MHGDRENVLQHLPRSLVVATNLLDGPARQLGSSTGLFGQLVSYCVGCTMLKLGTSVQDRVDNALMGLDLDSSDPAPLTLLPEQVPNMQNYLL